MADHAEGASEADHPHPRFTNQLQGHEAAEQRFVESFQAGRLHHAWLLTGPRGVGKATFAYAAARRVLGAAPDTAHGILGADMDDPVSRRIAAQSHGDLYVLERGFDAKKGRLRAEIPVDDVRALGGFLHATASEGGWRVVIVDAADEMNVNAANALLKTLEEPPSRALLLLVAHTPGRLPATVRSRCRVEAFQPPGDAVCRSVLQRFSEAEGEARIDLDRDAQETLLTMAAGRPGLAVALAAGGGVKLASQIETFTAPQGRFDAEAASVFADGLAGVNAQDARAAFFYLLAAQMRAAARHAAGAGDADGIGRWGEAWRTLHELERDLGLMNLDAKSAILSALWAAREAARA